MKKLLLILIRMYQYTISPFLPASCRFYPSCSEYSYQSIVRHGIIKGIWYSVVRLSKCHPFHEGGIDPVK